MNFDFWTLSFEGQLTYSVCLVTLLTLLYDDFANDNSSLLYYHDYNFVACCYCTKCLSIFLDLALKSLSEQ